MTSCGINEQITQVKQLSTCNFEFKQVTDIHLAGIPLYEGMKRTDINAGQAMQLASAIFSSNLPLDFNVILKVSNPNLKDAAINCMEYEVFLDDNKLITGNLTERVLVRANDTLIMKIPIGVELFQTLSGKSTDAIINLGFRLTGKESHEADIEVKIKPYIKVGLRELPYFGFITLKQKL